MKKLSLFLVVAFMSTLILDSCTVQKRYHRKGFNVNWNHTSIGGKKDKKMDAYSSSEEELAEVKEVKSTSKIESNNESANYSAVEVNDFASTSDQLESVLNSSTENVLVSKNEAKEISISPSVNETNKIKVSAKKFKGTIAKAKLKEFNQKGSLVENWVYLVLILLVPFGTVISMYLYEGSWTKRVTLNLILTLLCGLPGFIHALVVIFGNK
jgi:uncharacterized membrane protein YqaE (UPF0057 family)